MDFKFRGRLYGVIEILRTNILTLVIYYYLRMASEEILKRQSYICFKRVLITFCIIINILMITCTGILYVKMRIGEIKSNQICKMIEFTLYRWGAAISSLIFLVFAFHLRHMLIYKRNKQIRKLKRSYEESSMKRIYSQEDYKNGVNESRQMSSDQDDSNRVSEFKKELDREN